jgi:hypothetical protein
MLLPPEKEEEAPFREYSTTMEWENGRTIGRTIGSLYLKIVRTKEKSIDE